MHLPLRFKLIGFLVFIQTSIFVFTPALLAIEYDTHLVKQSEHIANMHPSIVLGENTELQDAEQSMTVIENWFGRNTIRGRRYFLTMHELLVTLTAYDRELRKNDLPHNHRVILERYYDRIYNLITHVGKKKNVFHLSDASTDESDNYRIRQNFRTTIRSYLRNADYRDKTHAASISAFGFLNLANASLIWLYDFVAKSTSPEIREAFIENLKRQGSALANDYLEELTQGELDEEPSTEVAPVTVSEAIDEREDETAPSELMLVLAEEVVTSPNSAEPRASLIQILVNEGGRHSTISRLYSADLILEALRAGEVERLELSADQIVPLIGFIERSLIEDVPAGGDEALLLLNHQAMEILIHCLERGLLDRKKLLRLLFQWNEATSSHHSDPVTAAALSGLTNIVLEGSLARDTLDAVRAAKCAAIMGS